MKINKVMTILEKDDEDKDMHRTPAAGKTGEFITTAQAAKILNVNMSRVRQLIADGVLKAYKPEKGRRDHLLKKSEVMAYKAKEKDKGGRPEED